MNMHRIFHLDLKGAPLKIPYFEKVLLSAKRWGATGVLLEWEDTFPYSGQLEVIGSRGRGGDELYSMAEVLHVLMFCKQIGLEAIQLVQTIGHMEFVLKHPSYLGLREAPRSPAVLCPARAGALPLLQALLVQALDAQPDARYFHIGADEVWYTAVCPDCQRRAADSRHKNASLFLDHVRSVACFIKQRRPEVTVLMWDDMLRPISLETLREYQLGDLVQPVLWHYNPSVCFQIDPGLWDKYRQLFPRVWAGSAFKGANGSCQIVSPVSRYVSNHEAWLLEFKKYGSIIDFAGIVLTGWSRYDHYATLCELLPVSLPSLASCLRVCTKRDTDLIGNLVSDSLPSDEWPGEELARTLHSFVQLKDRCNGLIHGDLVTTWLNPWQLEHNYTNPVQVEAISITAQQLLKEVTAIQSELSPLLYSFTGRRSVDEWLQTFLTPLAKKLVELRDVATCRAVTEAGVQPVT